MRPETEDTTGLLVAIAMFQGISPLGLRQLFAKN